MGSVAILFLIAVESLGRPSRVEASGLSPVAVASCTATWTDVGLEAIPNAWWSLATGAPDPSTFSLNPGCIYDTADPANTPLILPPAEEPPWMAIVNGLPVPVGNLDPAAGRISLVFGIEAGSRVQVDFYFDATNVVMPTPTATPTPTPTASPTPTLL